MCRPQGLPLSIKPGRESRIIALPVVDRLAGDAEFIRYRLAASSHY